MQELCGRFRGPWPLVRVSTAETSHERPFTGHLPSRRRFFTIMYTDAQTRNRLFYFIFWDENRNRKTSAHFSSNQNLPSCPKITDSGSKRNMTPTAVPHNVRKRVSDAATIHICPHGGCSRCSDASLSICFHIMFLVGGIQPEGGAMKKSSRDWNGGKIHRGQDPFQQL